MEPGRQDSILVTLSFLLKSMASGFPDLEVPPPSLITTNGPLLIKLPNPIILFAPNWVYSSGLLNILCWWVAQFHYVLCEGALPLVCFIKLPALTTPGCLLCFTFISFQAEWGLCGTTKHSGSSWVGQTSCFLQHKLQRCCCERHTLTTKLPQLWYNPDLWKLPSHGTQDPCSS